MDVDSESVRVARHAADVYVVQEVLDRHTQRVDPRNLLRVIKVAAVAAGVEGVGVHTLRHQRGGVMA